VCFMQRRQVIIRFARKFDTRQRYATKCPQQHLHRRLRRLPTGRPRLEAFESGSGLLQGAPPDELHQPQHAQREAQQGDQADHAVFVLQVPRLKRQRASFQPPEPVLNQLVTAIGGHGLLKAPLCGTVMDRIHAPAQARRGGGPPCFIARRLHAHPRAAHGGGRAPTGAPLDVRRGSWPSP
jgi:hypothetical protein